MGLAGTEVSNVFAPENVSRYTLYPVIVEPPLDNGAFHVSVTLAFPAVATRFCGADGTVGTVTVTVVE